MHLTLPHISVQAGHISSGQRVSDHHVRLQAPNWSSLTWLTACVVCTVESSWLAHRRHRLCTLRLIDKCKKRFQPGSRMGRWKSGKREEQGGSSEALGTLAPLAGVCASALSQGVTKHWLHLFLNGSRLGWVAADVTSRGTMAAKRCWLREFVLNVPIGPREAKTAISIFLRGSSDLEQFN